MKYLAINVDKNGEPFDGSRTYKVVLPKDIPAKRFWSFTVYDNQTRSMLQTPQRYPRAGSQSFPSPAAVPDADGSTTVHFAPKAPEGWENNWIQTNPEKGFNLLFRLYGPTETWFDKSWRPGDLVEQK
jgi:hypothetical protein